MQVILKKHSPGVAHHLVKVQFSRIEQLVTLNFSVHARSKRTWDSDPNFSSDYDKNWGLWNHDVVEAFLQLREHPEDVTAPYLEIQVSPLNQPFCLLIKKPREEFFYPKELSFSSAVQMEERVWTTEIKLELPSDLRGTFLFGGFFSCVRADEREFYALNPNSEEAPDFHRPDLFLALDE